MSPTRPELAATLVQLRRRVDAHFDAAVARSPSAFQCGPGCEACCHVRIGVFAVEAAPIRDALAELAVRDPHLRSRVRRQADDPAHADRCALLVDGRCAVYDARPLICRSHGLPIAAEPLATSGNPDAPLRVDHCPLNFQTETPPPRQRPAAGRRESAPVPARHALVQRHRPFRICRRQISRHHAHRSRRSGPFRHQHPLKTHPRRSGPTFAAHARQIRD